MGSDEIAFVGELARLDLQRDKRAGVPEVVFGAGKTLDQIEAIVVRICEARGRAMVSRLEPGWLAALRERVAAGLVVDGFASETLAVVHRPEASIRQPKGLIGVLAAGTSDIPVAEEARVMALEMGCGVIHHYDVGVAGLHRLVDPLQELIDRKAAAVVAVAGMEGALPTLIKGLLPVPVIGVPTSVGYGMARQGEAALMAMLNSCSLGLTVVNIDNGVGAGAAAALIARASGD